MRRVFKYQYSTSYPRDLVDGDEEKGLFLIVLVWLIGDVSEPVCAVQYGVGSCIILKNQRHFAAWDGSEAYRKEGNEFRVLFYTRRIIPGKIPAK